MPLFDTCIITAPNQRQAEVFQGLISRRRDFGLYPREIDFVVYSDPPGGRVGSGGGSLWALYRHAAAIQGFEGGPEEWLAGGGLTGAADELSGQRILILHAGGESRRLPAYLPEAKLFAPVPAASSSVIQPVVLDQELSLFLRYPWQDGEVVVASGDVIVDFDTELLDHGDAAICGFAAPSTFTQGARHGVFSFDPLSGNVKDYLQKADAATLARDARIEGTELCALDLGIVAFRRAGVAALLELMKTAPGGRTVLGLLAEGDFVCDLYLELLTACLRGQDFDSYRARVGRRSALGEDLLGAVHRLFSPLGLHAALTKRSSFLHFGSLREFPEACREQQKQGLRPFYAQPYEELKPVVGESLTIQNCSEVDIAPGAGDVFAELCSKLSISCEGSNALFGLRDLKVQGMLPRGFCIDERCLTEPLRGVVRMVYHRDDSFKPTRDVAEIRFCGKPLLDWLEERDLALAEIFGAVEPTDLMRARLFPPDSDALFLQGFWLRPADRGEWLRRFRSGTRYSMAEINAASDAIGRDLARSEERARLLSRSLSSSGFSCIAEKDVCYLNERGLIELRSLENRWAATDDVLLRDYRARILHVLGSKAVPETSRIEAAFASHGEGRSLRRSVKADQIVWARAPARLDLAGGWTDTPPYTNRYGGAVVNVAVKLNGQNPIQAFVRPTAERRLRFHSIDLGISLPVERLRELRAYRDPADPFSLARAALVLLGLGEGMPDDTPLAEVLAPLGCGMELTILCAVPKGSGLGTSSILGGVIMAALARFFGLSFTREELILQVLEVEQMLTTGGGWQDQIGGLVGGVKYIETRPGLRPRPVIHQLDSWLFEEPSSLGLMSLFYTGMTRLAKHILRDVVDRVNGMDRAYLFTHHRIRELAMDAREAIALRDGERLGKILAQSFEQNRLIHPSTTNREIEGLMAATAPFRTGMKLLGAGGGGFALFKSANLEQASRLRDLLASHFEDEPARLVDFSLDTTGLEVTVS